MSRLLPLTLLLLLTACGSERTGPLVRPYVPPDNVPDAGMDTGMDMAPMVEPECEGKNDGARCALENASGACVGGTCRFLACLSGFADCDDAPGCERDVQTETSCGVCDRACREGQACQLSSRGFLCSAGVVCPDGVFDLDQRQDNGCEWQLGGAASGPIQPAGFFEVQVAQLDRELGATLAGRGPEGRYVRDATTNEEATPLAIDGTALAPADAVALSMTLAMEGRRAVLVGWEQDITIERDVEQTRTLEVRQVACDAQPVRDVTWSEGGAWLQALDRAVARISAEDAVATFGQVEYARAFYPFTGAAPGAPPARWRFGAAEVAACTPCVFSTETGDSVEDVRCAGALQCQTEGFDASTCMACAQAEGECPSFLPQALTPSRWPGVWYVVTQRGVVVMEEGEGGWKALGRAESPFEPGVVSGARFVLAAGAARGEDGERVFLLHSTGFVRAVDVSRDPAGQVSILPAGADVGLSMEPGAKMSLAALDVDTLAVTSGRIAYVVGWRARSARSFQLPVALSPDEGFVEVRVQGDGFTFARTQFGNVVTQDVSR